MVPTIRRARPADARAIATLVNTAYEVERFFVEGDRTSATAVGALMGDGVFYVGIDDHPALVAAVFVDVRGAVGSFGLLAVHPEARGQGWARRLIEAAEAHARDTGATEMEIQVVNLRTELFPLYERFGYTRRGMAPYVNRPVVQPVHFVLMRKTLRTMPSSQM